MNSKTEESPGSNLNQKMEFVREENTLVKAKAKFGRGKVVQVNKYKDYVYVHIFGKNGKSVSLGYDEFRKLVGFEVEIRKAREELLKEELQKEIQEDEALRQLSESTGAVATPSGTGRKASQKRRRLVIRDVEDDE